MMLVEHQIIVDHKITTNIDGRRSSNNQSVTTFHCLIDHSVMRPFFI